MGEAKQHAVSWPRQQWLRDRGKVVWATILDYPSTLIVPVVTVLVLAIVGSIAIVLAANKQTQTNRDQAQHEVDAAANSISQVLVQTVQPSTAVAAFVKQFPDFDTVNRTFDGIASDLLNQVDSLLQYTYMEIVPFGNVCNVYPINEYSATAVGLQLLTIPVRVPQLTEDILSGRQTMRGPMVLYKTDPVTLATQAEVGLIVYYPVMVPDMEPNETFGIPWPLPNTLNESIYYNASTRSKFWGFVGSVIIFEPFVTGPSEALATLRSKSYNYLLVQASPDIAPTPGYQDPYGRDATILASYGDTPVSPAIASVDVPGVAIFIPWTLIISPAGGWSPTWKTPLIAVVCVVSVIIGVLLFVLLYYMRQHQRLLFSLVPRKTVQSLLASDSFYIGDRSATRTVAGRPVERHMVQTGTPVELLMDVLTQFLSGKTPDLRDVIAIRAAFMRGGRADQLYEPSDLLGQLQMNNNGLEDDVVRALMRELQGIELVGGAMIRSAKASFSTFSFSKSARTDASARDKGGGRDASLGSGGGQLQACSHVCDDAAIMSTMEGALGAIMQAAAGHDRVDLTATVGHASSSSRVAGCLGIASHNGAAHSLLARNISAGRGSRGNADLGGAGGYLSFVSRSPCEASPAALLLPVPPSHAATEGSSGQLAALGEDRSSSVGAGATGLTVAATSAYIRERSSDSNRQLTPVGEPRPPPVDRVVTLLEASFCSWTFDAFELADATQGHPLSTLLYFLFVRSGLVSTLELNPTKVARLALAIEEGYKPNPYHNKTHAADVLQTMHSLLVHSGFVVGAGEKGYCDPHMLLACLLAAASHDLEHSGTTNDFLIASENELATLYSDKSPMEHHHLACLFQLLKRPHLNVLSHMAKPVRVKLRKAIIELVGATDMKHHFSISSQFSTLHRLANVQQPYSSSHSQTHSSSHSQPNGAPSPSTTDSDKDKNSSPTASVLHRMGTVRLPTPVPLDEAEHLVSLQVALKCADLGSLAETHEVAVKWVVALEEEFFAQGDQERALGLPISPLFDREKPGVGKSQIGFYDVVALPLFHNFSCAFPGARPFFNLCIENYKYWKSKQ